MKESFYNFTIFTQQLSTHSYKHLKNSKMLRLPNNCKNIWSSIQTPNTKEVTLELIKKT